MMQTISALLAPVLKQTESATTPEVIPVKPRYITTVDELDNRVGLAPKEREMMETVTDTFPFRTNDYYLSLIDWKDRHDPLRRIVIPDASELAGCGSTDPSCEKDYTRKPGLQHKYDQTGLLLLTDVCGGICRFCFRKRRSEERRVG